MNYEHQALIGDIRNRCANAIFCWQRDFGVTDREAFVCSDSLYGSIPVLSVRGKSLAHTWEQAVLNLGANGIPFETQYDQSNDPPSIDSSMLMVVDLPEADPYIHRCFPGGLEDLEEYRQEVLLGIKDALVRPVGSDIKDYGHWGYTYHDRIFNYSIPIQPLQIGCDPAGMGIWLKDHYDQFEMVAKQLTECCYTRRAQIVLWKVWEDNGIADPACLQSMWFRILPVSSGFYLNMNVRFRSRDAFNAAFMNCFALIEFMKMMAERVSKLSGTKIKLGRYTDFSDSFHIYGNRLEDFRKRFLTQVENRSFEDRTWTMDFAAPIFDEAKPKIAEKVKTMLQNSH